LFTVPLAPPRSNIAAMCAAMAVFIVNDAFVKIAARDWSAAQIMAMRGVFAVLLMAAISAWFRELGRWRDLLRPLVAGRCLLEGFIAFTYISALAVMPIADVTAILLLSPLLITGAGALLLGETVRWRRWLAVAAGCVGMLLVVRPAGESFGTASMIAIISTIGVAARDLMTRKIPPDVPSSIIAFGTTLAAFLLGVGLCLTVPWKPLSATPLALSVGAAVLVAVGNLFIVMAFRGVDVSIVSPFRYTIIVWAILIGVFFFQEMPDMLGWTGIGLIVGAGLYTLHRETVVKKDSG
jgi:drug/metabolite transporter (DMT)-like permease